MSKYSVNNGPSANYFNIDLSNVIWSGTRYKHITLLIQSLSLQSPFPLCLCFGEKGLLSKSIEVKNL